MIHFDIAELEKRLEELEEETVKPNFWEDSKKSNNVLGQIKIIKGKCNKYRNLESEIKNILELIELVKIEYDEELAKEIERDINKISGAVEKFEIETLLSGKYDKNNAILTLHPGARRNRSYRLGRNVI